MTNLQKKSRISRLTFIKQVTFGRKARAIYRCNCGNEKELAIANVKNGTTYSCGCLKDEITKKHGLYKHPLYVLWISIKQRCYYKNSISFPRYGAIGVKMCDEWKNDFKAFYNWAIQNGWKKGMQIDKDIKARELEMVPLLYSPKFCQFVTPKKNGNNKSNNHYIEYNGITKTLQEWSEEYNLPCETLRRRIKKLKWELEKALLTPVKKYALRK